MVTLPPSVFSVSCSQGFGLQSTCIYCNFFIPTLAWKCRTLRALFRQGQRLCFQGCHSHDAFWFFFHSCSAHIPLSLFLAHARSHSICLGETQARVLPVCIFINKTYKKINGNLKATKIYKNIYFERAKQVPWKDTLYLCCVQLRLH